MKFRYWVPAYVWMIAIFVFSTDLFSAPQTYSITKEVIRFLFPSFSESTIANLHLALRKLGHIAEYAILSSLYLAGFLQSFRLLHHSNNGLVFATLVLAFLYACTDEWHQSFSALRTATIRDVIWDTGGATVAQAYWRYRRTIFGS